jgi:hypothetical protein
MGSTNISGNILNLLYKKVQGAPYTNPSLGVLSEGQGSSQFNVETNSIWNQPIPTIAPSTITTTIITNTTYLATKYSTSYPYITKYGNVLLSSTPNPQVSFYYAGTSVGNIVGTNILINTIPFNQDPAGSYQFSVSYTTTTPIMSAPTNLIPIGSSDPDYPWYFDIESGYLTFIGKPVPSSYYIYISFWRYEGTVGFSNIYTDISLNGNIYILSKAISTSTTSGSLQVVGGAGIQGNLYIGGNINIIGTGNLYVNGLSPFSGGTSSQWTTGSGNIYYTGGNVGIGTQTPVYPLDVSGIARITNNNGVLILQGNALSNMGIGNITLNSITSGSQNTTIGHNTLNSITTGSQNTAVGYQALQFSTSSAGYNTAVGYNSLTNNSSGSYNTALGYNAFTAPSLNYSTAIGAGANPTTNNQIVLGTNSIQYGPNSVSIPGVISNTLGNPNTGSLQVAGGVGIGGNVSIRGNVYTTGNVGIGTNTPLYPLQVIGTTVSTTFITTSDYRMKNNVQPLDITKSVQSLNPVEYDLSGGKHDMGFLAHEVQEIFPFLVEGQKDGENFQSLNYNGFIALLVKEIQELKKRVAILESNQK